MSTQMLRNQLGFAAGIALRRPFQCLIQVTNRCNMKCSFCDFWPNGVPPAQELSLEDYRRIGDELAGIGRFLISIEGGEPFVRRDLVEIVRAFSSRHLPVLYTNGWYVNADAARNLFEAGLTQVGVSIDFPEAARHDAKRGVAGAFERACNAVRLFREAAPNAGKQVHVMSVLMRENEDCLEELLQLSAELGVGHCMTLLSDKGFRRGKSDALPQRGISAKLLALWKLYPHLRMFRDYLAKIDVFLTNENMPTCRAGVQSFNIDHCGNVSPCIEKINQPVGNVREAPLAELVTRMRALESVAKCQDCWTLCRGFGQVLGHGGSVSAWRDLTLRMRS